MISLEEARNTILSNTNHLDSELAPISDALNRVLAGDVASPVNLPRFNNSSMDGFAVAAEDVSDRGNSFPISQTVRAGDRPACLERGTCAKIMTGACVPSGADAVVPVEDAKTDGGRVVFLSPVKKGRFIRQAGEDIKKGETALRKDELITERTIAFLAAMGIGEVEVYRKPRVFVVTTGNELIPVGSQLEEGKIYDSNRYALDAALSKLGIRAELITVKDDENLTKKAIEKCLSGCDALITVGGVSVGEFDFVRKVMADIGVEFKFWRVAIKPGKPFAFGKFKDKPIFGIPGNPVSCLFTFDVLVKPALRKMAGHADLGRKSVSAITSEPLEGLKERTSFLAGFYEEANGRLEVRLCGAQGSAMLKSYAAANCVIEVPKGAEIIEAGEKVLIEMM